MTFMRKLLPPTSFPNHHYQKIILVTYIHIHSQIHHPHQLDWMWNSSWKELNCTYASSQNKKLQTYIKLARTW